MHYTGAVLFLACHDMFRAAAPGCLSHSSLINNSVPIHKAEYVSMFVTGKLSSLTVYPTRDTYSDLA